MAQDLNLPVGFVIDEDEMSLGVPEGFVVDETLPQEDNISVVSDVLKSAGSGLGSGAINLLNLGGAAVAAPLHMGVQKIQGKPVPSLGESFALAQEEIKTQPQQNILDVVAYSPDTYAGKMAKVGGETVGTLPLGGALGLTKRAAALAGFGGAASVPASDIGGRIGEELGGDTGKVVGEVVGGLTGAVGGGYAGLKGMQAAGKATAPIGRAAGRVVAPTIEQETAILASRAKDFDIPLSLSQVAPTKMRQTAQKVSQAVPLSGVSDFSAKQTGAWNRALSNTIGESSDKLSPATISKYLDRSGKGFDNVFKGAEIKPKSVDIDDLYSIYDEATQTLNTGLSDVVKKNVDSVVKDLSKGTVSGQKLASMRSKIAKNSSRAEGGSREYISDIVNKIDEIAEKSLSPSKVEELSKLRREYRNFKTLEPLLEKSVDGNINPTSLLQRVASSKFMKASRTGAGEDDLVDLARIGKIMPKLGGSDTFEKTAMAGGVGASVFEPVTVGTVVAGNRAYQNLYNQSQKMLSRSLEKSLPKGVDVSKIESANAALSQGGTSAQTADKLVKVLGGQQAAKQFVRSLEKGGDRNAKEEAFYLIKEINKLKGSK